jgi:plastocyanin
MAKQGKPMKLLLVTLIACSSPTVKAERPSDPKPAGPTVAQAPAKPAPTPKDKVPAKLGPVGERAQLFREAADQLDKAQSALDRGNKNLAEQLFSTAELLVGAEALASIAMVFREGAPPRVTGPTQKIDTSAPAQPRAVGNSEDDDDKVAPPKVQVGSLSGQVMIDGKPANAFGLVTLEPANGKWKPRTAKKVVVEQRGREFLPNLLAVSVGSTVSFPNFDPVFHNVFSTSPVAQFDLGLYKAGEAREFTFQKEGIVRLGCNLHANMSAYIAIVNAPAYVVTDPNGNFSFRRVVPGKYKLRAWSTRSKAPITQDVTIKAGKNEISVGVAGDAPSGPQPDKFGGKRG